MDPDEGGRVQRRFHLAQAVANDVRFAPDDDADVVAGRFDVVDIVRSDDHRLAFELEGHAPRRDGAARDRLEQGCQPGIDFLHSAAGQLLACARHVTADSVGNAGRRCATFTLGTGEGRRCLCCAAG